jgi:hypothetical protein
MHQTGELNDDLLWEDAETLALPPNELILILGQADELTHWIGWVLRGALENPEIQTLRRATPSLNCCRH